MDIDALNAFWMTFAIFYIVAVWLACLSRVAAARRLMPCRAFTAWLQSEARRRADHTVGHPQTNLHTARPECLPTAATTDVDPYFHPLPALERIEAPHRFTYPLSYVPHPLARLAAADLRRRLAEGPEAWRRELDEGKMLGVMVVEHRGQRGYLAAFSGLLASFSSGSTAHSGRSTAHSSWSTVYADRPASYADRSAGQAPDSGLFVPPIYDLTDPLGHFRVEEAAITELNRRIDDATHDPQRLSLIEAINQLDARFARDLDAQRRQMQRAKALRNALRQNLKQQDVDPAASTDHSADDEASATNDVTTTSVDPASLIRQSQHERAELHRLRLAYRTERQALQQRLQALDDHIADLRRNRHERSDRLQTWLFRQFRLHNARGEVRDLVDIFASTPAGRPPSGAGECCAPRLLQYAYLHDMHPLCMAEMWWGRPRAGEVRHHLQFYPACTGRCRPLLAFMLQGLEVDPDPEANAQAQAPLQVVYEDEALAVVVKPAGMPSVSGLHGLPSVESVLRQRWQTTADHRLQADDRPQADHRPQADDRPQADHRLQADDRPQADHRPHADSRLQIDNRPTTSHPSTGQTPCATGQHPQALSTQMPLASTSQPQVARYREETAGAQIITSTSQPQAVCYRGEMEGAQTPSTSATQPLAEEGARQAPLMVHRLDMDTSGLMVVARTKQAQCALQRQFEERKVKKTYRAIVCSPPTTDLEPTHGCPRPDEPVSVARPPLNAQPQLSEQPQHGAQVGVRPPLNARPHLDAPPQFGEGPQHGAQVGVRPPLHAQPQLDTQSPPEAQSQLGVWPQLGARVSAQPPLNAQPQPDTQPQHHAHSQPDGRPPLTELLQPGTRLTISLPLSPDPMDRPRQRVDPQGGKQAVTEVEVVAAHGPYTELLLHPTTGRTHQLRVHCASTQGLGKPIVGDRLYGHTPAPRLLLHAEHLAFVHPLNGQWLSFDCPAQWNPPWLSPHDASPPHQ